MWKIIGAVGWILALISSAYADYTGPFTTQVLYTICSASDQVSKDKCEMYMQGLLNGLYSDKAAEGSGTPLCLPVMTSDQARARILKFIDQSTGGNPGSNKDGGDWMAYMGLANGNTCKRINPRP
jgi:hypothetical protein